jgi:hypothetical protein
VLLALHVWEPVRVAGMSMSPTLVPGDVVLVRRRAQPTRGSIVLVRRTGHRAVLHRAVAVRSDGSLVTKGDANTVTDREPARREECMGVVERVVPLGVLFRRWRGLEEVGYHDGSTEQREAMTEKTPGAVRFEQRCGPVSRCEGPSDGGRAVHSSSRDLNTLADRAGREAGAPDSGPGG